MTAGRAVCAALVLVLLVLRAAGLSSLDDHDMCVSVGVEGSSTTSELGLWPPGQRCVNTAPEGTVTTIESGAAGLFLVLLACELLVAAWVVLRWPRVPAAARTAAAATLALAVMGAAGLGGFPLGLAAGVALGVPLAVAGDIALRRVSGARIDRHTSLNGAVPAAIALIVVSVAYLLLGGSAASHTPLAPATRVVTGEVRTPDARTPLVRGDGLWRCETAAQVELRVSPEGLATLSVGGRLLASVTPDRALINRRCTAASPRALPRFRAPRAVAGEILLRCSVPRLVLVDLRDGDLTVRAPGRGRFLLGAAVSEEHLEAAGHWSARCTLM
jgi:hypothetical protein